MTVTRGASASAAVVAVVLLLTAVGVAVSGLAVELRQLLDLRFGGVRRTPGVAVDIAAHNGRLALGVLACAVAAPRLRQSVRLVLDAALAAVLAANALAVGAALGAYGRRAVAILAPHLLLELAALSLCGGAYLSARRGPLRVGTLARTAALTALLLAIAAIVETYVQIGAQP